MAVLADDEGHEGASSSNITQCTSLQLSPLPAPPTAVGSRSQHLPRMSSTHQKHFRSKEIKNKYVNKNIPFAKTNNCAYITNKMVEWWVTWINLDINRLFGGTGIVNIPFSLPRKIEFLYLLLPCDTWKSCHRFWSFLTGDCCAGWWRSSPGRQD